MKRIATVLLLVLLSAAAWATDIRVMSYNIRLGVADDGDNCWDKRRIATPAMLDAIRPDVFGVQEAYTFQLDYIYSECPRFAGVGVGRDDGKDDGEHMSVIYNSEVLELVDWGTYWLSETPDVPSFGWDAQCRRTATWTLLKIKATGEHFYFVNTHLDHVGKDARRNGLALVYDRISRMNPENYPMVLTGDFNVRPDDPCLEDVNKLMKPARFTAEDADTCGSFNGWGKYGESGGAPVLDGPKVKALLPIDYIYWMGFSRCLTFKVVRDSFLGVPYISDHYPIYSDLEF